MDFVVFVDFVFRGTFFGGDLVSLGGLCFVGAWFSFFLGTLFLFGLCFLVGLCLCLDFFCLDFIFVWFLFF